MLAAVIPGVDSAQAQRLVEQRNSRHFTALNDVATALGQPQNVLTAAQHSVNSQFFEVYGQLRLDKLVVQQHSVVQRQGLEVKALWTDRGPRQTTATPLE